MKQPLHSAYDASGSLTNVAYSDGTPFVSYAYDRLGRTTAAVTDGISTNLYAYSFQGLLTNETVSLCASAPLRETLTRSRDPLGRPAGLTVAGVGDPGPPSYHVSYGYDAYGRLSQVSNVQFQVSYARLPGGFDAGWTITTTNGTIVSRMVTHDRCRGLVTAVSNAVNGAPVSVLAYTYDALGRVVSRNGDAFGYNPRSELTGASIGTNGYGYGYDGIGNALWSTNNGVGTAYLTNPLNQYTAISKEASITDPSYDLDGNMLTNGVWSYAWDGENRLVAAYSNSTLVVSNAYDHMSRRILKVTQTADHCFLYDGWNLIQETICNPQSTITNHYVWGLDLSGTLQGAGGIGGLLAVIRDGEPFFPCCDANGNVTEYLSTNGTVVAHYEYDPFGNVTVQCGSLADAFSFRFSTKYHDPETGLVYYGYRYYAPEVGRWVSRDPILEKGFVLSYFDGETPDEESLSILPSNARMEISYYEEELLTGGGDHNPFVFVLNNPLNGWDDKGLDITLETGNDGKNYLNNKYHQAVCVDTWVNGNGSNVCSEKNKWQCCHLGKTCFSFGKIPGLGGGQLPQFSSTWLGWSSTVVGAILRGEIYTPAPVPGATIDRRYVTTMSQDFNWERYMWRSRMYTRDAYSVARHNCRKYSQWEFRDASHHW